MVELQTYFVLTRNISWWIFISSIFRRFYFPCIWKALEMKNMIKWRRDHIRLVFMYTTKNAVEQPQCWALWTSYIPVPKVSIVWNFQPVITITLQGYWFPYMEDDGFGKWIKEWGKAEYNWNIDCTSNTWDFSMQSVNAATMITTMDYVLHSVPRIINSNTIIYQGIWFPYMFFLKVMVQAGWSSIQ